MVRVNVYRGFNVNPRKNDETIKNINGSNRI